jgi:hypothetical protein
VLSTENQEEMGGSCSTHACMHMHARTHTHRVLVGMKGIAVIA